MDRGRWTLWALSLAFAAGCSSPDEGDAGLDADTSPEADVDQGDADGPRDSSPDGDTPDADRTDADRPDADGDSELPSCRAPSDRRLRILFIGNSFTLGGPIPTFVQDLATADGWPEPETVMSAYGGYTLEDHRSETSSVDGVAEGGWDFVVLQELSTRPTDNAGDPERFKLDATWFYDQVKEASPLAQVVLYETWARHPDHSIYPGTFDDPAQMQAQLSFHYNDAADSYIPTHSGAAATRDVAVAPAGDAWEAHLAEDSPIRLHGDDDYHAGGAGQYLNAAVLYSTIYGCRAEGLIPLSSVSLDDAARLQAAADATTGEVGYSPMARIATIAPGQSVRFDLGAIPTTELGWNTFTEDGGEFHNAVNTAGELTAVDLLVTDPFSGANEHGVAANELGMPGTATQDNFWTGSHDGHAAALLAPAQVVVGDLDPAGHYTVEMFNSRGGADGTNTRTTRFTVTPGGEQQELDATDNVDRVALFDAVSPDANGRITIDVEVSPVTEARFAYLSVLTVTRQD